MAVGCGSSVSSETRNSVARTPASAMCVKDRASRRGMCQRAGRAARAHVRTANSGAPARPRLAASPKASGLKRTLRSVRLPFQRSVATESASRSAAYSYKFTTSQSEALAVSGQICTIENRRLQLPRSMLG